MPAHATLYAYMCRLSYCADKLNWIWASFCAWISTSPMLQLLCVSTLHHCSFFLSYAKFLCEKGYIIIIIWLKHSNLFWGAHTRILHLKSDNFAFISNVYNVKVHVWLYNTYLLPHAEESMNSIKEVEYSPLNCIHGLEGHFDPINRSTQLSDEIFNIICKKCLLISNLISRSTPLSSTPLCGDYCTKQGWRFECVHTLKCTGHQKIYFDMWKGHSLEVHCTNIQLKIFIK